jgi:Rieske Fe-S protein
MNDSELSRRGMLGRAVGLVAVVGAGVVGYAVAANSPTAKLAADDAAGYGPNAPAPTSAGASTAAKGSGTTLAALDAIPDGGGLILPGKRIVLTRSGSTVHGFSTICTHQGCPVNAVHDGKIFCPCHGSEFDASTGAVVAGPAPRPLPAVAVTVVDGEVMGG